MRIPVFVEFPCAGNSVAVQIDDIRRIEPLGGGSCVKLYGRADVYSSASVRDALRQVRTVARAAEREMLRRLAATETVVEHY